MSLCTLTVFNFSSSKLKQKKMFTRVSSLGATATPGNDAVLNGRSTSSAEEGAARVSLARINSTYDAQKNYRMLVFSWAL